MNDMPPTVGGPKDDVVPIPLARTRLYLGGYRIEIIYCPQASVTDLREVLPVPGHISLVHASEDAPGVFQIAIKDVSGGQ